MVHVVDNSTKWRCFLIKQDGKNQSFVDRWRRLNWVSWLPEPRRAYAKWRPTWTHVRNSLEDPRVKPIIRRIEPLPNQIEHKTKVLLNSSEFRAGTALTDLVDRTIVELEKVKRKLDRRFPQRCVAA